jgi:hypothetical protein
MRRLMLTKADYFILMAALLSFLLSVALWFGAPGVAQNKEAGLFVGLWVPSILAAGRYFRSPHGGK